MKHDARGFEGLFAAAELQRGFMVMHYTSQMGWVEYECMKDEVDRLQAQLTQVKAEVPCPECLGAGGDGIKSEHQHPCYEDPQSGVPRCEDFDKKDCLHKDTGAGWATCGSGGESEYIFRPCKACQGTGKKYPEES